MSEDLGPRVVDERFEGVGLWLTWEESAMGGWCLELKQRRLSRLEGWLWRLFGRVPQP